jgi:predicted AAA+ superfamily ATPase
LSDDDAYAQRMLREDVVDKVIKRDVLTLFNIRNPLLMEKLFLYLCINSSEIFNASTAGKELENITVNTIDNYIDALEMSNLIYVSKPTAVGSKSALKGKPKIYIADAAIRNAVLMVDDVLSDETELGVMVETTVFKHMVSFYQNDPAVLGYYRKLKDNQKEVDVVIELPREKILCEVKYKNNSHIAESDAIVELCREDKNNIRHAFLITKRMEDFGITRHETDVPIMRIPAIVFLLIPSKEEKPSVSQKKTSKSSSKFIVNKCLLIKSEALTGP